MTGLGGPWQVETSQLTDNENDDNDNDNDNGRSEWTLASRNSPAY